MAPFVGPDRETVLRRLRGPLPGRHVPMTLGYLQPQAVIDQEDGAWTLRPLVLDRAAARAAGREARAAGRPWMPEMEWRFLQPGAPRLRADSAAALADALEAGPWPWSG